MSSVDHDCLSEVKSPKQPITVQQNQCARVICRANVQTIESKTPVLFEADEACSWPTGIEVSATLLTVQKGSKCCVNIQVRDTTDHSITLKARTVLGRLSLVSSVMPLDVKLREPEEPSLETKSSNDFDSSISSNAVTVDPEIEHEFLRPLYPEVKQYIEELLNKGWIKRSCSNYSSPVVCVRKKDGTLRLCIDYRQLNQQTIPDRHPLPRVKDALESLGGNEWFSLLDQGRAYH